MNKICLFVLAHIWLIYVIKESKRLFTEWKEKWYCSKKLWSTCKYGEGQWLQLAFTSYHAPCSSSIKINILNTFVSKVKIATIATSVYAGVLDRHPLPDPFGSVEEVTLPCVPHHWWNVTAPHNYWWSSLYECFLICFR